jgi:oligoribonuclease NrnB/cAMP/cGMP phosphodiesterase (DHH superfamily)
MKRLVIYHRDADGFCSAFLLWKKFPDATFYPTNYGEDILDQIWFEWIAEFDEVYIVDFSYARDQIKRIHCEVDKLVVLDHHKTAEEELRGLPYCTFDMHKAGCMLTFDYLFGDIEVQPNPLVEYVQDYDLWKFNLPYSREINAAIRTYDFDFGDWEELAMQFNMYKIEPQHPIVTEGRAVLRAYRRMSESIKKSTGIVERKWNHEVLSINSACLQSEIGGRFTDEFEIVDIWFKDKNGKIRHSLRSKTVDVGNLCRQFGGGGHSGAAGFEE